MPQLLVRNVPQDVVEALKRRAAKHGHSAEAEHRIILEEVVRAGRAEFRERAAALREATRGRSRWLGGAHSPGSRRTLRIVIDASFAVKWVLRETGSEAANAQLDDHDLIARVI